MKIALSVSGLVLLLVMAGSTALALDEVQLGEASYSGSVCPVGSVMVQLGQNKRSAKIEFNALLAQAGDPTQKEFDSQECDIQFPVHVPAGFRVSVSPVTYSANVYLPYGTTAQLHLNYYFQYSYGISQQNYQFRWWGEQVKDYDITFPKKEAAPFWSNCGTDMKLRMNMNLMAESNRFNHGAKLSLNRVDGFELKVEKCN
jgi:hypothetical protein